MSQKYNRISQTFSGTWLNQKVRADLNLESSGMSFGFVHVKSSSFAELVLSHSNAIV